jgi:hypothetical protein
VLLLVDITEVGACLKVTRINIVSYVFGFDVRTSKGSAVCVGVTKALHIDREVKLCAVANDISDGRHGERFCPHAAAVAPTTQRLGAQAHLIFQRLKAREQKSHVVTGPIWQGGTINALRFPCISNG